MERTYGASALGVCERRTSSWKGCSAVRRAPVRDTSDTLNKSRSDQPVRPTFLDLRITSRLNPFSGAHGRGACALHKVERCCRIGGMGNCGNAPERPFRWALVRFRVLPARQRHREGEQGIGTEQGSQGVFEVPGSSRQVAEVAPMASVRSEGLRRRRQGSVRPDRRDQLPVLGRQTVERLEQGGEKIARVAGAPGQARGPRPPTRPKSLLQRDRLALPAGAPAVDRHGAPPKGGTTRRLERATGPIFPPSSQLRTFRNPWPRSRTRPVGDAASYLYDRGQEGFRRT